VGDVSATVQWVAELARATSELDDYDRFMDYFDYEMKRGKCCERPVSLLMLHADDRSDTAQVQHWHAAVRKRLRPVDRLAAYDAWSLLVLLPEIAGGAARALAESVLQGLPPSFAVRGGLASAPAVATTHQALLARTKEALLAGAGSRLGTIEPGALPASDADSIVAVSTAMVELDALVKRVAQVDLPVLVLGETGSGKEMVARALHEQGPRRHKPLRALNCGAIPGTLVESVLFGHEKGAFTGAQSAQKGLFELASGGSVLLDEVGELSASAQAALLRTLETRKVTRVGGSAEISVDVRVIAATHRDLDQMVRDGTFRLDLQFRLNTIVLEVPPLRDRVEEIGPLAEQFRRQAAERLHTSVTGFDSAALRALSLYRWPGNVRELRNVIERACVLASGPVLGLADLPARVRDAARSESSVRELLSGPDDDTGESASLSQQVRAYETRLIIEALKRADWNQSRAADILQIPLRTLLRRMASYRIKKRFDSDDGF
jgi:two-component system, NtrC family, response regulator AtoC